MHHRILRLGLTAVAVASLTLTGCLSTTVAYPPCCYEGEVALASIGDLGLELEGGRAVAIGEAFPGYRPETGIAAPALPFREADIALVPYRTLRESLQRFDANGNGVMEPPELTVLLILEGANALDRPARALTGPDPADAVVLSQADRGGLIRYLADHREDMNPRGHRLFWELDLLSRDLRTDADGPDDRDDLKLLP